MLLGYRPHPNDGANLAMHPATADPAAAWRLPPLDAVLVCLAGAIWGILNGAFAIMVGFAPSYLGAAGLGTTEIGLLTGTATWLVVGLGPGGRDAGAALGPAGAAAHHHRAGLGGLPGSTGHRTGAAGPRPCSAPGW